MHACGQYVYIDEEKKMTLKALIILWFNIL
jgi:hypothetical protein